MTPINAIASVPPGASGLESGAARSARQAAPDSEPAANAAGNERSFWDRLWGKDGFSFGALLDAINPLQHIPVVSTIYRAATGDAIGPAPRIMGGALFGGVIGLITSAADAVVEGVTGKDTGSHVMAMLPDPEPVSQWIDNTDDRRHRGLMTAVLNLPGDSPTQFADDKTDKIPTARDTVAAATQAATTVAAHAAAPVPSTPDMNMTAPSARNSKIPSAAALQHPAAMIPASAQQFSTPARTVQSGAGGRQVPLSSNGRPVTNMPSPKDLAANPALLQELRQGGAAAVNAAQKNSGRIDTAIKGRGLVAPGTAKPAPVATPAALDVTANLDAEAPKASAPDLSRTPVKPATAARDTSSIPEVGPDFLMKMQQALEKYQSMRAAPTVDVAH
jgi:hypothetical protein